MINRPWSPTLPPTRIRKENKNYPSLAFFSSAHGRRSFLFWLVEALRRSRFGHDFFLIFAGFFFLRPPSFSLLSSDSLSLFPPTLIHVSRSVTTSFFFEEIWSMVEPYFLHVLSFISFISPFLWTCWLCPRFIFSSRHFWTWTLLLLTWTPLALDNLNSTGSRIPPTPSLGFSWTSIRRQLGLAQRWLSTRVLFLCLTMLALNDQDKIKFLNLHPKVPVVRLFCLLSFHLWSFVFHPFHRSLPRLSALPGLPSCWLKRPLDSEAIVSDITVCGPTLLNGLPPFQQHIWTCNITKQ